MAIDIDCGVTPDDIDSSLRYGVPDSRLSDAIAVRLTVRPEL